MDTYIGSLLLFGGNFAIRGYMMCWGQIISIAQNTALFSLLGTTYGGNGQTTFALPDLRGRSPIGWGQGPGLGNYASGQLGGTESTTLTILNMPAHNHAGTIASASVSMAASAQPGTTNVPGPTLVPAALPVIGGGPHPESIKGYAVPDTTTYMAPTTQVTGTVNVGIAGGSQPFSILNPYLAMTWLIANEGIFPSRN
ncbi:phage tail protein [Chitinophaga sp. sic0106]|uniref:phage tail protein n=1 Tax=Chitinophaga sp. sic0106 TaxID=2854785 RepID=UPI001C44C541|nr:tail fiber protein [Chitinophaga sp. sic0106]MBV7530967.1 tail fiber protein [Chitinophaga sp. sic0106]